MFDNFKTFEEIIAQETAEAKESRLLFEAEKKQELKQLITKINRDIFHDILPIKVMFLQIRGREISFRKIK